MKTIKDIYKIGVGPSSSHTWLEEANYQDHCGRYDLSAELYERLVAEEYPFSKPYDRLASI